MGREGAEPGQYVRGGAPRGVVLSGGAEGTLTAA